MAGRRAAGAAGPATATITTPATAALGAAGVAFSVHPYHHDVRAVAEGTSYGLEAATALGVPAGQVFKTLLAQLDGTGPRGGPGFTVAVVPVDRRLDLRALAVVRHAKRAVMAQAGDAERATGYVVGGISPVGQRLLLPTVVDSTAAGWPVIYISAGRRGVDMAVSPADLIVVTSAVVADISC